MWASTARGHRRRSNRYSDGLHRRRALSEGKHGPGVHDVRVSWREALPGLGAVVPDKGAIGRTSVHHHDVVHRRAHLCVDPRHAVVLAPRDESRQLAGQDRFVKGHVAVQEGRARKLVYSPLFQVNFTSGSGEH